MNMWLVGAGYWGSKIMASLKKFDVDAQVIDVKNGQSIDDINTKDPVILATPLWEHFGQTMELLSRGHDVYVEKPAAETIPEIVKLSVMVHDDQLLMVGHLFIHHPQMEQIKNMLQSGVIGEIQHITSRRLNWGIYQTKTSPTLSLATHDISIVLELLGNDCKVSHAQAWNYTKNPKQHDRVAFSGTCGNATFDIDVSWAWPVRTRQTVIIGTRGQIIWDQDANTLVQVGNGVWENRAIEGHSVVRNYESELSPLEHELYHWVSCVRDRKRPITGIKQAYSVAVVIDQVDNALQNRL
jgi:hypothetical protein